MAEKNKSANLCENVEEESILNVTQDNLVSTNIDEHVDDTTDEIEIVDTKSSKSNSVDIFNQLALTMEVMKKNNDNLNEFRTEVKLEINIVNDKLDKQDEKMKAENNKLKSEIKSEINVVNNKLTDLSNEFVNVRSELRISEVNRCV